MPGLAVTNHTSDKVAASLNPTGRVPVDVDGNGDVGPSELAAYRKCADDPDYNAAAALDGSGCVDPPGLAVWVASRDE